MAKVLKYPKIKNPIVCTGCGTVYKYEDGDKISIVYNGLDIAIRVLLECPVCGLSNTIQTEG